MSLIPAYPKKWRGSQAVAHKAVSSEQPSHGALVSRCGRALACLGARSLGRVRIDSKQEQIFEDRRQQGFVLVVPQFTQFHTEALPPSNGE